MAKISPRFKTKRSISKKQSLNFSLSNHQQDIIFIVILALLLVYLLKPLVIDGLSPQGVDVIGNLGKSHVTVDFFKKTGEPALWNPNVFSGMPVYYGLAPAVFSADSLLSLLGRLINLTFFYYLFAGLGMYGLLRYLKMSPIISLLSALLFVLMPHYKSLYLEGHMAKFKALMFLPWIIFSFKYFLDRRSILGAALFALAFGSQIRTQHYQIVFYTGLFVFAIGVYPFLKDLLEKQYLRFAKSTGLLLAALTLGILMAAQPLFLAKEYLPYSKRGKTTIDVSQQKDPAAQKSDGVSLQYATQWSTHPSEILTWFVPRFYGGMSAEKYTGSKVPQAKGQLIPGYWGHMPFTQSYEYMGAVTLLLAAIGLFLYRKDHWLISMAIYTGFLILLSFGQYFQSFYSIFFNNVPYFNKFRAPMMSVTVTFFIVVLFTAYGLQYLYQLTRDKFDLKQHKNLLVIMASFFVLGVILWLFGQTFSFVKASGERYQGETLQLIKTIRQEMFNRDMIRYIILILLAAGGVIGYLKNKINFTVLTALLALLATFDLITVQNRVQKDYMDVKRFEASYFRATNTDRFLNSDQETFRIFPAGDFFTDNRWAYYHQTIGGYTPIKMYVIEELVENNIYKGWDAALPFNWNVLKILNVKYVILPQKVESEQLALAQIDEAAKQFTYLFTSRLPRAFFVGEAKIIKDEYERIRTINSRAFDPAVTAVVEEPISEPIFSPDSSFAQLTSFTPNRLTFDVFTDKQSLLVISEVFYPPGWKIFVDKQRVNKIYKTDHAVQSIIVQPGKHTLEMRFEPDSYFRNKNVAAISVGVLYLSIIASLAMAYLKKRKG